MRRIRLKLSFDGHKYFGWQDQKEKAISVQGCLNQALQKIYKQEIKTTGSGRTDAKVHSLCHYVTFSEPFEIPFDAIIKGLNSHLPADIRVYEAISVSEDFRPTNDAKSREYHYLFSNEKVPSPFQLNYMTNITYPLNIDAMREAAKVFVGEHDFCAFHCTGSEPTHTIRNIFAVELVESDETFHGLFPAHYCFRIRGSGFLKQMVRLIMGALFEVGRGKLTVDDIKTTLESKKTEHIAPVAHASGLYKKSVEY